MRGWRSCRRRTAGVWRSFRAPRPSRCSCSESLTVHPVIDLPPESTGWAPLAACQVMVWPFVPESAAVKTRGRREPIGAVGELDHEVALHRAGCAPNDGLGLSDRARRVARAAAAGAVRGHVERAVARSRRRSLAGPRSRCRRWRTSCPLPRRFPSRPRHLVPKRHPSPAPAPPLLMTPPVPLAPPVATPAAFSAGTLAAGRSAASTAGRRSAARPSRCAGAATSTEQKGKHDAGRQPFRTAHGRDLRKREHQSILHPPLLLRRHLLLPGEWASHHRAVSSPRVSGTFPLTKRLRRQIDIWRETLCPLGAGGPGARTDFMGLRLRSERPVGDGWEVGNRGCGRLGRDLGNRRRWNVLPERDRLRWKPRRGLDGDVVLPERDRQSRPHAGWRGLPLRAGHRVSAGDRNLDRQRRRDVLRQHAYDGQRAVHLGALVSGDFVDPNQLRRGCQHHHGPWIRVAHLHVRGGRRVLLFGNCSTDRGAGDGLRRTDDERQLHTFGQPGDDLGRRGRHRSTTTASREAR